VEAPSRAHEPVLEAWYRERKQQLGKSLASTIDNGKFVTEANPFKIFFRTCYLFIMNLVPKWRHELHLGRRKEGMVRYQHRPGMPFIPELNGGLCLPQVYCKSIGENKEVLFTDEAVFSLGKKGLFQLLVYLEHWSELEPARETVASMRTVAGNGICVEEATYMIHDMLGKPGSGIDNLASVYQLASGDEFAASPLCEGRPKPRHYDPDYLANSLRGGKYVIVRPDRFIFAACATRAELERAISAAVEYLAP
jgi:hypothetical protein